MVFISLCVLSVCVENIHLMMLTVCCFADVRAVLLVCVLCCWCACCFVGVYTLVATTVLINRSVEEWNVYDHGVNNAEGALRWPSEVCVQTFSKSASYPSLSPSLHRVILLYCANLSSSTAPRCLTFLYYTLPKKNATLHTQQVPIKPLACRGSCSDDIAHAQARRVSSASSRHVLCRRSVLRKRPRTRHRDLHGG